jgi:hypothetical protein
MSASVAEADSITVNGFNNNTAATVTFNDGAGHSGSNTTLLTQFNVTLTGVGSPITFDTFSIDLFHTVTAGQTYLVNARGDLATALVNGSRIAYIFRTYGLPDLTNNPDQAAAVQLALWDLSLNITTRRPSNWTSTAPTAAATRTSSTCRLAATLTRARSLG